MRRLRRRQAQSMSRFPNGKSASLSVATSASSSGETSGALVRVGGRGSPRVSSTIPSHRYIGVPVSHYLERRGHIPRLILRPRIHIASAYVSSSPQ